MSIWTPPYFEGPGGDFFFVQLVEINLIFFKDRKKSYAININEEHPMTLTNIDLTENTIESNECLKQLYEYMIEKLSKLKICMS